MNKKISSTIFGLLFLIWFFGSMALMFYFAKVQSNVYYALMVFGQYFLVFGLIPLFKKKLIGLPFFLVGLACIIVPFFMLNSQLLPVKINWDGVIPLLLVSVFVIAGFCLIIIPLYQRNKRKEICTVIVPAQIVDYDTSYNEGTTLYAPIYEYTFNGKEYRICNHSYSNVGNRPVGTIINLKIDPNNPTVFEDNHASIFVIIILGIFFLVVSLPIFIFMLMNLELLVK